MKLNGAYWKLWHDVQGRFLAALLMVGFAIVPFDRLSRNTIPEMWSNDVLLLLLFIGIILSVGPPFCGESMEAFSLTFSLPWTRQQWLKAKVQLSMLLIVVLILLVFVAGLLAVHSGGRDTLLLATYPSGAPSIPHISNIIGALLAGAVGVSLGTLSSMYSRNMLNAAVAAGIAAYVVAMAHIAITLRVPVGRGIFPPKADLIGALFVLGLTAVLATSRLRNRDY